MLWFGIHRIRKTILNVHLPWSFCGQWLERGIRRSEVRFLMGTQNFFFVWHARDKTEKNLSRLVFICIHTMPGILLIIVVCRCLSHMNLFPSLFSAFRCLHFVFFNGKIQKNYVIDVGWSILFSVSINPPIYFRATLFVTLCHLVLNRRIVIT